MSSARAFMPPCCHSVSWVDFPGEDYGQALGTVKSVPHSSPGEETQDIEAAKLELILRNVDLSPILTKPV
ncbi:hypothetical protein M422DRAFT_277316 [Sphaerobolus stellatus SS14]|uniref:Uncharacterized protein n=1 Tax=Sphaerobolus stellatus (strain SS14) TaxID=990650 RepID=A0A0C9T0S4_SPHS4|nr:hypothetical protein M422DRAFT_277316 [Sphaerobolus stellatus SS14]